MEVLPVLEAAVQPRQLALGRVLAQLRQSLRGGCGGDAAGAARVSGSHERIGRGQSSTDRKQQQYLMRMTQ